LYVRILDHTASHKYIANKFTFSVAIFTKLHLTNTATNARSCPFSKFQNYENEKSSALSWNVQLERIKKYTVVLH